MTNQNNKKQVSIEELKKILQSLNAAYRADQQTEKSDLFANGILDSLSLIQFVMAIEKNFQIRLENEDITYEKFKSLGLIKELLLKKYIL
jgi:methoxymalonate biosynthesis acyl carrier protein